MEEIFVAKSYIGLPFIGEPYIKNKKKYVKVQLKSGKEKEIRIYNSAEYEKMYPLPKPKWAPQRKMLGFGDEGYIIIFKGADRYEEYFSNSNARYSRFWGWYVPSNETVPVLPEGVSAVVLPWENVGGQDGELYPEDDVIEGVRKARHY